MNKNECLLLLLLSCLQRSLRNVIQGRLFPCVSLELWIKQSEGVSACMPELPIRHKGGEDGKMTDQFLGGGGLQYDNHTLENLGEDTGIQSVASGGKGAALRGKFG